MKKYQNFWHLCTIASYSRQRIFKQLFIYVMYTSMIQFSEKNMVINFLIISVSSSESAKGNISYLIIRMEVNNVRYFSHLFRNYTLVGLCSWSFKEKEYLFTFYLFVLIISLHYVSVMLHIKHTSFFYVIFNIIILENHKWHVK